STKKDAGYTIFYMGINAGAFLGMLLCGYIGEKVGWHYGFGLAGIFMLFGALQFYFGRKIFGMVGESPQETQQALEDNIAAGRTTEEPAPVEVVPKHVERDRLIVIGFLIVFSI